MRDQCYYVYIITNFLRTVLYIGVTNNLKARLLEHYFGTSSFTASFHVHYLLYYEHTQYINNAIQREKQLKNWSREKKLRLIATQNPGLEFLNTKFFPEWPPKNNKLLR